MYAAPALRFNSQPPSAAAGEFGRCKWSANFQRINNHQPELIIVDHLTIIKHQLIITETSSTHRWPLLFIISRCSRGTFTCSLGTHSAGAFRSLFSFRSLPLPRPLSSSGLGRLVRHLGLVQRASPDGPWWFMVNVVKEQWFKGSYD